jgi:hypothetical protein
MNRGCVIDVEKKKDGRCGFYEKVEAGQVGRANRLRYDALSFGQHLARGGGI